MNIPITKEFATRLEKHVKNTYLYGSRLFGVHNNDSDYDIIKLYNYNDIFEEIYFLPNMHSFKYTDTENNIQSKYNGKYRNRF